MDAHQPEAEGFRLLLIEDNAVDGKLIQTALERGTLPCQVEVATSLKGGIAAVQRSAPDVVLLDLWLPDSQGMETFHAAARAMPLVPIVILSSTADEQSARQAVANGAQDYLVKGDINLKALGRALRYSVERHRFEVRHRGMEEQLAQARKLEAIGQLAAGIAHEINTPTQYVSDNTLFLREGFSSLLQALQKLERLANGTEGVAPDVIKGILEEADVAYFQVEIPQALDQTVEGLGRVIRIVRAMKEFSHPAGLEMGPTDLNKALEATVIVASNEWKYVAEMELDLDPTLPPVTCLGGEMSQVFLNLIVNAAHAIESVLKSGAQTLGKIKIATRSLQDGNAEIRITDSGTGIAPEHLDRIFDPFFTTKAVGKGTGQGLAIAYNVVKTKHRGSIEVSTEVGKGTTFTLRIPISPAALKKAA
jgi:signal transduction histidine kinase